MRLLETGNEILGIKEYNLLGCRFLYREGMGKTTVVTFSAFPPKDVAQKYNYIKDFLQSDYSFLSFLDTALPSDDPRGTYYLSDNLGTEYLNTIHCVISLLHKYDMSNIWLLGSSKGGVGALLLGLKYGYSNIIINAPQALLADYIKIRSLPILSYMIGDNSALKELNYYDLNQYLLNSIRAANTNLQWNIHITCGNEDAYHLKQLEILRKAFDKTKIPVTIKIVRGGHDNLSIADYRKYFLTVISNVG